MKKLLFIVLIFVLSLGILLYLFLFGNSTPKPNIINPITYNKNNLSFQYPGNWFLNKNEIPSKKQEIIITNKRTATIKIYIVNNNKIRNYLQYSKKISKDIRKDILQKSESTFNIDKPRNEFKSIKELYKIEVFPVQFSTKYYYKKMKSKTLIVAYDDDNRKNKINNIGITLILNTIRVQ